MNIAWLFPGQGSQYPQMGRHIWNHPLAADVLSLAESLSGLPLRSVIENGPDEKLRSPQYLEPSIVALQASHVLILQSKGMQPAIVAGYSLGEIGAAYCAGCLSLVEALTLASARGRILARHAACGSWLSFAATLNSTGSIQPCHQPIDGTYIAAFNSPRGFTITGEAAPMRLLEHSLAQSGTVTLPVAIDGPWHSPLAEESAAETAQLLQSVEIRKPQIPLCLATSGKVETDIEAIRESLSRQIDHPIFWTDALDTLWQTGVRSTLEIGPGRVLTSFVRASWTQRTYQARFLDRQGGRPVDFAALKTAYQPTPAIQPALDKEKSWTRTA